MWKESRRSEGSWENRPKNHTDDEEKSRTWFSIPGFPLYFFVHSSSLRGVLTLTPFLYHDMRPQNTNLRLYTPYHSTTTHSLLLYSFLTILPEWNTRYFKDVSIYYHHLHPQRSIYKNHPATRSDPLLRTRVNYPQIPFPTLECNYLLRVFSTRARFWSLFIKFVPSWTRYKLLFPRWLLLYTGCVSRQRYIKYHSTFD